MDMSNVKRDRMQGTYTLVVSGGNRTIWFDRSLRLWTEQTNDVCGDQVGTVDYTVDKAEAFRWLLTGSEAQA